MSRWLIAVLLLALFVTPAAAQLPIPRAPDRRINDFAAALPPTDRDRLEQKLIERERRSSNQVVVALFRSLGGESLEDYSIRLAQAWRVGQKGLDNGVIFLIFADDRKMRIEVGYGLEAVLTDAVASSILRDVVAPRFREGRLTDGIAAGLDAIDAAIAGTYQKPARPTPAAGLPALLVFFVIVAVALVIMLRVFSSAATQRRRRRYGWTGGPLGWGAGPYIGGPGWGGHSSRGGFGGGGFRGGGGGFGGGGASGSWSR